MPDKPEVSIQLYDTITPSEAVLINGRKFASRKRPYPMVMVLTIFLIMMLYMVYSSALNIKNSLLSKGWPVTDGQIETARIAEEKEDNVTRYGAEIRYAYFVKGKNFRNDKLWFGYKTTTSDSGSVFLMLKKYIPGMKVTVSYDPGNPQVAVLEPGLHLQSFIFAVAGLAIIVALVPVLIFQVRLLK